ncbi:Peroxisome biogenesis factor 1, N-terminal [Kalmanozyma brasiliensis GHG001]|uniref:Peroxisomal ATPase PEX1 n=1 Tax=Kalmanozyma brasiliensis (strain GHG001) TaxID=1365824 RepID=V5EYX8_KALBG|nr:Peroxisome biogenesis factor 1, N-terminal [Kalmanozyma brasiliensis GHG001]EST09028.1 Peroxisome biogenesis factor 1, N-terminal [Kalmanozyma brasiliensis GHG001]
MSRSFKPKGRSAKSTIVRIQYDPTLKSSLVHLPMCLYAPLVDLAVPPQSLVVEIDASPSSTQAVAYYAGWSGMSAAPLSVGNSLSQNGASSSANGKASASDVLNVSPSLAASFRPPLQDGATCSVRLLRSPPLPTATKIDVTPLSADDWEILSLHAEEVELNMLGQVRAATTGQVLTVHVGRGGNTVVRFRVDSTTPSTAAVDAAEPDTDDTDSAAAIAVRLSTDTEVIIAPRLRKKAVDASMEEEHSLQPINKPALNGVGAEAEVAALRQALPKLLWRVLPQRFAEGLQIDSLSTSVAVSSTSDVGHDQLLSIYPDGRLSITKVSCPTNNSAQEMNNAGRDKGSSSASANGFDDAAAGTANAQAAMPARPTASARFVRAEDLPGSRAHDDVAWPERHVLLGAALRDQLGIQDYDLVRFGAPPPGFSKSPSSNVASQSDASAADSKSKSDTASELAGVDHILRDTKEAISACFRARALEASSQPSADAKPFQGSSSLLLTGGPGSGKTVIAKHLAADLSRDFRLCLATSYFDCSPFSEDRVPVLRARFSEWLNEAAWKAPSLLILDNIDRIMPAEMEHVDSQRSRQLAEAFVTRVRDCVKSFGVFVVATAQGNTSIHSLLNSSHLWLDNVQLKPPGKEGRREILAHLVQKKLSNANKKGKVSGESAQEVADGSQAASELNFVTLATQTEGYLPADLRDLVERATHQAAIRSASTTETTLAPRSAPNGVSRNGIAHAAVNGTASPRPEGGEEGLSITMDDFVQAQDGFTPLSLRDVKLEKSSVAWSDIGGLIETRRVLRETLEWPTKYAAIFASCPLRLRSGLLLYGYPGCGKTLLASAVAKECGLNFISVKGPEILNKYIGASEKSVRDLFDRAQAAKPCVLFFDEFDSIAPKRGHDSTGVTDRVVNQMLTQMDGAEGLDGVYVLAATSRPDLIDSALLRPGRLDKSLLCDMPTEEDRLDIMKAIARKVHLHPEVDLEKWATKTDGFSGADLQALLYNAHLEAIHESISAVAEEKEDAKKDADTASDGTLKFTTIGGGGKKTLSGAERQALVRKLELVLKNTQSQPKNKPGRILPAHLTSAAPNGVHEVAKKSKSKTLVTEAHLETSIKSTRPSVPLEEQRRLRGIYRTFAGDRDGNFPDGEASTQIGARSSLM